MPLNKRLIGGLLKPCDDKNDKDFDYPFFGLNIDKEFMPSVADTSGCERNKYKVVKKGMFVFSGMQTGRDGCIRIGLYEGEEPILVSPAYTTFKITSSEVDPNYFFMLFKSKEMDRFGAFLSDSSIRSNLDWNVFCNIELSMPELCVQKKYSRIYSNLVELKNSLTKKEKDLERICNGAIGEFRRKYPVQHLSKMISEIDQRNVDGKFGPEAVAGLSTDKQIILTKADLTGVNLRTYKLFPPRSFAYVPDTSRRGDKISLAFNNTNKTFIVSSISEVFAVNDEENLVPEYLALFFNQPEFDRYARFNSWGSAREPFSFDEMKRVSIPFPDSKVQRSLADLFVCLKKRQHLATQIFQISNKICPILIVQSLKEGSL